MAEFQLGSTEEIKRWILSLGKHAAVLEPETLRADLRDELRDMADVYSGRKTPPQRTTKNG